MSSGYSWEGIRQVRATLLGVRHVPECLCGGLCLLGALYQVLPLPNTVLIQRCRCRRAYYATRCKAGCGAVYKLHDVIYIDTDYTEHTDTEE